MNQGARHYHAQGNWEYLPTTLDRAVYRITSSVRPAMLDDTLIRQITRAADTLKESIRHPIT